MELFKLLGTIAIDNTNANKALDETSEKGHQTQGKLAKAFGAVGKGAVAVGKAVGTGMIAAGTAVAGLVTKSTQAYAQYEQLVGGVETLFKDSAGIVMEYADNAYKTAGMSANAYMETVTSFSASLLQSLGGDTAAAAEKADMAITDMSDNANKMGTSMEMIQNAYQGFAKQNYTMLDNLKLGYGGTKEEMQRLLEDAQAISGVEYDISSYADIVDAIHVIQSEMGITGTTAKEASGTISGSIGMMKGSWENLMTAMSDKDADFGAYINKFVDSVATVGNNVLPVIETALGGAVRLIDQLAPVIISKIPGLVSTLLPTIVNSAVGLINALVSAFPGILNGLMGALPALIGGIQSIFTAVVEALPGIMESLVATLPALLPLLINGLVNMIITLCTNFAQIIQPIIDYLPDIIISVVNALMDNLPALIMGVAQLVMGLVAALPQILQAAWEVIVNVFTNLPEWFGSIFDSIVDVIASIFPGAKDQIMAVWEAIKKYISTVVNSIKNVITTVWNSIKNVISTVINAVKNVISTAWNAIKTIIANVMNIIFSVIKGDWESVRKSISNILNAIKSVISSVWNGIKSVIGSVLSGIKNTISSVFNGIKSTISSIWNGIKSVTASVWNGIKTAMTTPIQKARDTIKGIVDRIKGFFTGMKLQFPNVKLPHFSISPSDWKIGDLLKGSIPKLGISWYAKAMNEPMIMTKPTIFGYDSSSGQLMGGGEAGSEVVSGTNTLMNMIQSAVAAQNEAVVKVLTAILNAIVSGNQETLRALLADKTFKVGEREFARLVREYA